MSAVVNRVTWNSKVLQALLWSCLLVAIATPSEAVVAFDQNVTPDAIFGSGNANGSFTVDTVGEVEIGLRGKLRFDATCTPQNTFNSNGDGTYSFAAGVAPDGPGGAADCSSPETPVWAFDWSVNTDNADPVATQIDDFTYELGLDFDASLGTSFCTFDNITPTGAMPFWDHSIGDNSTPNGGGTEAGDGPTYTGLIAANNVAQNTWRYDFFDAGSPCGTFDPNVDGTYDIYLLARDAGNNVVARSDIQIIVGAGGTAPVPASSVPVLVLTAIFVMAAMTSILVGIRRSRGSALPMA